MRHKKGLSDADRQARSELLRLLTQADGLAHGSLIRLARRCGNKNCRCATQDQKHQSWCLGATVKGRTRMQQWFNRAITLATNYYDAAKLMSFYLEPRWYGSADEALEFARSCVTSTNMGGRVPLVLADVHHSLAAYQKLKDSPQYWQRSEVWDDVRSAYDRFFALNPDASGYRHDYALDAYLCGHYAEFLAQAKLFPWTNFQYFGGEDKFRQMLTRAAAAKQTPP